MFVSDAGPIISFVRAGELDLLRQVVGELWVPPAVFEEVTVAGKPGRDTILRADWIRSKAIASTRLAAELPHRLGRGEREAIVLAGELGALLLIDDAAARQEAMRQGISALGSLAILREAKLRAIVEDARSPLDGLWRAGFRISGGLYDRFLREMGET